MSGQWNTAPAAAASRQASLRQLLARVDVDLRFLYPAVCAGAPPIALHAAEELEQLDNSSVLRIPARNHVEAYRLRWPKDVVQAYEGSVAVARSAAARQIAQRCGAQKVLVSPWCEGGMVVKVGQALLVSSALLAKPDLPPAPGSYRVISIPAPLGRARRGPAHIDLDCAVARTLSGSALLLVSPRLMEIGSADVEAASRVLGAELFVAPLNEVRRRALNFVYLHPGSVLMPAGCLQTQTFLASRLGVENVLTVRIDRSFNYNGGFGGLGCMSTFLPREILADGGSRTPSSAKR